MMGEKDNPKQYKTLFNKEKIINEDSKLKVMEIIIKLK